MMKKYIFITHSIKRVGGVQCYVAAKSRFLESNGWDVKVFCTAIKSPSYKCPIQSMEKYLNGVIVWLGLPPFKVPTYIERRTIKKMISVIGDTHSCDEIIIESHADVYNQWGEILASKIGARHFLYTMNEYYRDKGQYYDCKMDFYLFKFHRKEILGAVDTFNRLFEGYLTVKEEDIPGTVWLDECPIQDIPCEKVDNIEKKDWNICYIGRGTKSYVPFILSDVATFASKHADRSIQLITVSNIDIHKKQINKIVEALPNLSYVDLGTLHPIPLSLYSKIDVVIAGSGSARHSCEVGALTIIADSESCKSDGILGYDTLNALYEDKDSVVTDFCEALERALIKKDYKKKGYKYPPRVGLEKSIEHNFHLYSYANPEKVYYDESKLLEGGIDMIGMVKRYVVDTFPRCISFIKRLKYSI